MRGDQLARQWRLIQRLAHSRYGAGLDELAEDLGCVRRTVYRDLDALMFAGFPVVSEKRDGRVRYRFLDSFEIGDTPFTAAELLALAFGEDLLRILEGTVFHDSIRSAIHKIRASLGPELGEYLARLGESFRVLPGPHKRYARYRDTIQALNQAVQQGAGLVDACEAQESPSGGLDACGAGIPVSFLAGVAGFPFLRRRSNR